MTFLFFPFLSNGFKGRDLFRSAGQQSVRLSGGASSRRPPSQVIKTCISGRAAGIPISTPTAIHANCRFRTVLADPTSSDTARFDFDEQQWSDVGDVYRNETGALDSHSYRDDH